MADRLRDRRGRFISVAPEASVPGSFDDRDDEHSGDYSTERRLESGDEATRLDETPESRLERSGEATRSDSNPERSGENTAGIDSSGRQLLGELDNMAGDAGESSG